MHHILAARMAPTLGALREDGGTILIEKVVLPFPKNQSVRIVKPMGFGKKVILRPVGVNGQALPEGGRALSGFRVKVTAARKHRRCCQGRLSNEMSPCDHGQ